jgi:hypothetical protein
MAALMGVGVAELVDRTCQRTGSDSKVCLAAADGVISH